MGCTFCQEPSVKILFSTDFHIGFRPKSHVTSRSARLYEEAVLEAATAIKDIPANLRVNLGDLFDKYSNSESVILDAKYAVEGYDIVMSGNHDVRNIYDSTSSLELLAAMRPNVYFTHQGAKWNQTEFGDFRILTCCHYFTQGLFEEAIRSVCDQRRDSKKEILLLHCNVGDGHGEDIVADQSSLYLTSELQELVSSRFDLVLVGHEHVRRRVKDNLIVLGNHFPLSFGEMADRFVHVLDTTTMELEKIKVFDVSKSLKQISAGDLMNCEGMMELGGGDICFVEVDGEIKPEQRAYLSKALVNLWKHNDDSLLAVRNNVTISAGKKQSKTSTSASDFMTFLAEQVEEAGFAEEMKELNP
jgi:hypothetical protein